MTETLCTSGAVFRKAGTNASSTITASAAAITEFINQAEGKLGLDTRYDWVTNYANVSAIGKEVLEEAVSDYAAIAVINYDMSGFTSRQEALTMVNILWAKYVEISKRIVDDEKYKDWILNGGGTID